jgi:D-alanyl-D-alanine carboxypeptidase/D-alanyl-D-alanine-endopeptidase (penicillin-binding protein 4)
MLLPSDNFMAEQLLLNYSAAAGLTMSTDSVIKYMLQNHLTDLPDKPQWVDGSGLSRQNLFSPADLVKLCEKIYDEVGDEKRLFALLPNGGRSGTLKKAFKADIAFIFAKTGSLSNNYNLTGYLKTEAGKTLIFSFMNNNFLSPIADIKAEVERILTLIHTRY